MIESQRHKKGGWFARQRQGCRRLRRGLAPLEFVLWLPILLSVMALMVNYGTMATWRVRGEVVSHDAALRTRWPRTAGDESSPGGTVWPRPAEMLTRGDDPITALDDTQIIPSDIRAVVRGPLPDNFGVRGLLDPLPGAYRGVASIRRTYPFLPRLGGINTGEIANPLLDRNFSGALMGIHNVSRRTVPLYDMPWDDAAWNEFEAAWQSIRSIANFDALRVLERDDDWLKYSREYRDWHRMGVPDFHPRVSPDRCTLDWEEIYRSKIEPLIDVQKPDKSYRLGQISRLPRTLTSSFLSMYRRTKSEMEAELDMLRTNPPPDDPDVPQKIAFILRELPKIESKIGQLERFEKRIPPFERKLEQRS